MIDEQKLLVDLLGTLQSFDALNDRYFSQIGDNEVINPFQKNIQVSSNGIAESIPAEFFTHVGIRSVTLNKLHDSFDLPRGFSFPDRKNTNQYKWHHFRNTSFIENLKIALKDCQVIAFSDWAMVDDASQLWDGFLSDVIKPLNRKDMEFIFYLGDPTKRLTHEVDEIIDIISDFSIHGKVTFLLNEREAVKLWTVLHGQDAGISLFSAASPGFKEKYHSIFNAMRVDRLLIYSIDHAILISGQQQFELKKRTIANRKISQEAKDNFNAGYSLGLLLQLDISHCIALGLTVSGVYLENGTIPDREALLSYIERWIGELEPGIA
jgi:hypothetical protein